MIFMVKYNVSFIPFDCDIFYIHLKNQVRTLSKRLFVALQFEAEI